MNRNAKRVLALLVLCVFLWPCTVFAGTCSWGSVSFDSSADTIDLGDQTVGDLDAFIRFLQGFPALKNVDMFATPVEASEIELLVNAFPDVHFGWTIHIARDHYIRTDATAFSTLHGSCVRHDSKTFEPLKYCTELRALDLGHNSLTDISFLEPLTHLRVLILADSKNLRNIEVIGTLRELEYLELFSCSLRDISCLKNLPYLMDLNLAFNTGIRDWSVLLEMKQLKRLWISKMGGGIGQKRVNELRAALPDTWIMAKGEPTDYGWRKDSAHYDVIYQIFHTDVYIPFEDSVQPWPDET